MNRGIRFLLIVASPLLATRSPVRRTATGDFDTADQDFLARDEHCVHLATADAHPRQDGRPQLGVSGSNRSAEDDQPPHDKALARRRSARSGQVSTPAQLRQYVVVVFGAHVVLYSRDAEADRKFLAEKLGMSGVDVGHGWLIFAMPPSEVAVHPADAAGAELYFMCDDLAAEIESLTARGVSCSAIEEARWGSIAKLVLPGGGEIGLYQPRHPLAIDRPD